MLGMTLVSDRISMKYYCGIIGIGILGTHVYGYPCVGVFDIWYNPAFTINLPWLDVCIWCGRRGFFYAKHRHPGLGNK